MDWGDGLQKGRERCSNGIGCCGLVGNQWLHSVLSFLKFTSPTHKEMFKLKFAYLNFHSNRSHWSTTSDPMATPRLYLLKSISPIQYITSIPMATQRPSPSEIHFAHLPFCFFLICSPSLLLFSHLPTFPFAFFLFGHLGYLLFSHLATFPFAFFLFGHLNYLLFFSHVAKREKSK